MNKSNANLNVDKKSANIKSSIIKTFTCYIGSEWHKGLIFFLFTTIKIILELVFVINIKVNSNKENIVLTILHIWLYLINVFLSIKCLIGNPGILPANSFVHNIFPVTKKIKWYVLKGRVYRLKVCPTCFIMRPLGSGHCKKCNVCIERYDHHCPWVGSCIGRNNYKYFFFLLISINVYFISSLIEDVICFVKIFDCIQYNIPNLQECQSTFPYDLVGMSSENHDAETKFKYKNKVKASMYISIIFTIVNSIGVLFVFILLIRHLCFLTKNETTYMRVKMKNILKVYGNTFDKGTLKNIKANLFKVFLIRTTKKTKYIKGIAKVNTFPIQKINESTYPINVSYNCYVSYNSRCGFNTHTRSQQGSMIQFKNNEGTTNKSPQINGTISNISKSFEEDVYSQHNTFIHYKNENASYSYKKPKNGSPKGTNLLKPNVFFTNHEEDNNHLHIPNAILTNYDYSH